ncbi:hypothetical protein MTO96_052087 [Rhipicephalus appendiculatus]
MFSQALNKWSRHILMATPLPFLLPVIYSANKPGICLYVMLWMVVYWVSAVIPLPVTSLMPLVLFPLLGILSTEETASAYFNEVGATIFASVVFGAALERTGLATRVALRMLYVVGTSFSSLLFVFMVGTALLSMLFSNAATTAIVAPVVAALVEQMKCHIKLTRHLVPMTASLMASTPRVRVAEAYRKADERLRASLVGLDDDCLVELRREMMMSVAYAASIGGTGALSGTPGNSIMTYLYKNRFPSAPNITPVTWMIVNVPTTIVCLFGAWTCSYWRLKHIMVDELVVLMLLLLLVYLWSFKSRDSTFSWTKLLPADAKFSSSTIFLLLAIPLFAIPRCRQHSSARYDLLRPRDTILSWPKVASRCHWNIMLLVSGSLTFSKASRESGLSDVLQRVFVLFGGLHHALITAFLCLFGVAITQVMANAGESLPCSHQWFWRQYAVKLRVHPMSLAMPVTLSSSFGFMLPASTSPNAIVFDMARMGVRDMVWPGCLLAIICVTVTILLSITWGRFVLQLQEFPEWAADNETISDIDDN